MADMTRCSMDFDRKHAPILLVNCLARRAVDLSSADDTTTYESFDVNNWTRGTDTLGTRILRSPVAPIMISSFDKSAHHTVSFLQGFSVAPLDSVLGNQEPTADGNIFMEA